MNDVKTRTEIDAAADLVEKYYAPEFRVVGAGDLDGNLGAWLMPKGMQCVPVDEKALDEARGRPRRKCNTVRALSAEAFVALVNRYKCPGQTVIYVDPKYVVGVLNEHGPGPCCDNPDFRDHRVIYEPEFAPEWLAWVAAAGRSFSQQAFAEFLEERSLDLLDPSTVGESTARKLAALGVTAATPATLIALARDLSVRVKSQVREARNLSTGEAQVIFTTEHSTDDGKPLIVPGAFVIGIPVHRNGQRWAIVVRLRYRVQDNRINWHVAPINPDAVLEEVRKGMLEQLRKETGLLVVEGQS